MPSSSRVTPFRLCWPLLASLIASFALACSSSDGGGMQNTGGASATGGAATGGGSTGGNGTGGAGTGGASTGGARTGGAASGGSTGGSATGGLATGGGAGSNTGGAGTGGASQGGGKGGMTAGGRGGAGGGPAGAGGTRATGGAGGAGAFSPCPAAGRDCAIMPLGDSITDGYGTPGGYRIELYRKLATAGQHATFVGRNSNGPGTVMVGAASVPFPQHHEGYSGYTIDPLGGRQGISPLADAAISAGKPNIILLQIGTNDIDLDLDVGQAPVRLGKLLDQLTTDAPDALLVLAQITPLNYDAGNTRVRAYNAAMPALVSARVGAGKHIVLVDNYSPFVADASFKTSLLADQWHPNPSGYALMAGVWYEAIKAYLH